VIKSEKRLNELSNILKSKENIIIAEAINELRNEEPFEGAISLLASFFDMMKDKSINRTIEEFFNDLKDNNVRKEVIAELRKPWKEDTISMLVASCWQSGLDYSEYLPDMAKIFLEGNYATAIECMTVIEESVPNSTRERKDEIIRMINNSPLSGTHEKYPLTQELVSILMK
jgi:hypothetical protein